MKQWVFILTLFSFSQVCYTQPIDRYWSGGSGSFDDISQPNNWWGGINPNPDDNLFFNNTVIGGIHTPYCDYGSGDARFGYIIVYNGAGGITWRGGYETSAYKFENYNDPNTFKIECFIANRTGSNVEMNPVFGPIEILTACQFTIQSGQYIDVYGSNTLTVNGIITGGGNFVLQSVATPTVLFNNANSYTGHTYVNGGTLKINYTNAINSTNNVTINGGTLQISENQTINNLTLTSGTLTVDAGKTLTINGTYSSTGGTIINNGTIVFNSSNSFPGTATTLSACYNLTCNANVTLNKSITITNNLTLNSGTFALNNNHLLLNGASLTATSGVMSGSTTSDLTVQGTTGGTVTIPLTSNITLRNITVSNTRTLSMNGVQDINLTGTMNIGSTATYDNGGESQLIDGGGTPVINIYGKFITRDAQGFTGTSSSIPGIAPTLFANCTIEYARAGDQSISIRTDYQNIIFSNGGTKTPVTASPITPIAGTVYIKNSTVVDVANNTFGSNTTNLTMTETSTFKNGGSGVKPDIGGTYSLALGTTIEYYLSSSTNPRVSGVLYANVIVNGTNVNTTGIGTGLTFQTGGTFTVKTGALFAFADPEGFSGATTTAVNSTNSPTITLESGSTIEYRSNASGMSQTITNAINYKNLKNTSGIYTSVLAGSITVEENLDLSSGVVACGTNTINLWGNITGTATQTNTSGKILMTGASATISGATLGNLELNNAAGFSLSGSPTITNVLTLNTGKLTLGNFNISLSNTATGAITSYDASDYIVTNGTGLLRRDVTNSTIYDFPVGTASKYELATVTTSAAFAGPTKISARFVNTVLGPPPSGTTIASTPVNTFLNYGYWNISPNVALSAGTYNIALYSKGHTNAALYWDYHGILKSNDSGATWSEPGTHVVPAHTLISPASTGDVSASAINISAFSWFAIAFNTAYILPIVLTDFTATLINADVWLQWHTSSEVNNDYFEIQRSLDGSIWNTLGQVDGAGSTSIPQSYAYTDYNAPGMILYYRLKQVDYNGEYAYSDIRVVNNLGNEPLIIFGYYTVAGQRISNLENAPAGIYFEVSNKGNRKVLKVEN